jgi:hypothetical protein
MWLLAVNRLKVWTPPDDGLVCCWLSHQRSRITRSLAAPEEVMLISLAHEDVSSVELIDPVLYFFIEY